MIIACTAAFSSIVTSRKREFLACAANLAVLSCCLGAGQPAAAQSLPTGGTVVSGNVAIGQPSANNLTITQSSATGIVNWSNFSIGQGYQVQFNNGAGATLNRVTGNVPSSINGSLSATGSVYLVNPAGIAVGPGGVINTGGSFVASTLDVKDADFRAGGSLAFSGDSQAAVVNMGKIGASKGDVVMIARRVRNDGSLTARNGTVAMASGNDVLLSDSSLGGGKMLVRLPTQNGEIRNTGRIRAAEVKLHANGGNVYALAGNAGITATGVANKGGRIFLTAQNGSVTVTQKIVARRRQANDTPALAGANGKAAFTGGDVAISGDKVVVGGAIRVKGRNGAGGTAVVTGTDVTLTSGARIDASGTTGGTVLIGGDRAGGGDAALKFVSQAVATARTTTLEAGSIINADGTSGAGGNVVVWADGTTSFAGAVSAKGLRGGFIETSGHVLDLSGGSVNAGSGGTWLLDPVDLTIDSTLAGTIASSLNAGTNVIQQTTASGSGGSGDITVASAINWSTSAMLTLSAYRNIVVNAGIASTGGGAVVLRADNSGTGAGTVNFSGGQVSTAGAVSIFYNPAGNNNATVNAFSYTTPTNYSGNVTGGGSLRSYMLVNTVYDLQNVRTTEQRSYALGRNIDASVTATWNGGVGFVPIGLNTTPFEGTFDGQSQVISGLVINRSSTTFFNGLFGFVGPGGSVANLSLQGATVTGGTYTGGLVGFNNGSISNVSVSATVTGTDSVGGVAGRNNTGRSISNASASGTVRASVNYAGGLVGDNQNATISNSSAAVTVVSTAAATSFVGGLVGRNEGVNSLIQNSYATGAVSAGSGGARSGGLAGVNSGRILRSYATGNVSGNQYVGGLVGTNSSGATITQSYATGTATAANFLVGGLLGSNAGTVTQSYWDTVTSGRSAGVASGSAAGMTGLTTSQMQNAANFASTFAGWDFATVWSVPSAGYYPQLYGTSHVLRVDPANASRAYGDANTFGYSVYGLHVGDAPGIVTGLTLSSVATPSSNVGTYAITVSGGSATSAFGKSYRFVAASPATLTVTPRPITVTANGQSRAYGDLNPALTYQVGGSGLVNGDTLSGALVTAATTTSNVGSYAIAQGTLAASANYTLTSFTGANLAVTPRSITVTANGQSRAYGDVNPALTYQVGGAGLANGDTLSGALVTSATTSSNVGAYAIDQGTLAASTNYALNYTGANLAVTPRSIAVTADGQSRTYGDVNPALTYQVGGSGLVNGDTLSGALATAAAATSNVGAYAIAQGTLAASGNYTLNYTGANLAVTPRSITVAADGQSRTYGDVNPALTYQVGGAGLVNGDTLSGALATAAAATSNVGAYAIAQGTLAASANYTLASFTGANLAVTPRSITVAADGQGRAYGDVNPALTYQVGGSGLVNGDTLSGALATAAAATSNVGSYAIDQGTLAASANYTLASFTGANLAVTPRSVTVTANGQSRAYGDVNPALTYQVGGAGLANGDTLSGALATAATTTSNVGAYAIAQGTLAASANYALSYTGASLAVTPRSITVAADGQSRTYGDVNPVLTYQLGGAGLTNGDTLSGALATAAAATSNVGSYTIAQGTLAASANYALSFTGANLAITPRSITVAADGQSRTYGDVNPALTYQVGGSGLANGDTLSGALATSAAALSNVGSYAIAQGTLAASANYTLASFTGASLAVTPRSITVTADATAKVANTPDPALTYRFTSGNLVGGDTLTGWLVRAPGESLGSYAIQQGTLAASSNYALSFVGANLTITTAPGLGSYVKALSASGDLPPGSEPDHVLAPAWIEQELPAMSCSSRQCLKLSPPDYRQIAPLIKFVDVPAARDRPRGAVHN